MNRSYLVMLAALAACGAPSIRSDGGIQDAGQDGGGLPPGTTTYSLNVGPLPVQAGTQIVYCTNLHLHNPQPIDVIGFSSTQTTGGHHLILVENNKDVPDSQAPWVCGQGEAINPKNGSMLYISQIEHDQQIFPTGVGIHLPANASVMLQVHYIDATPADLTVSSTVNVLAGAPGSVTIPAAPALLYDDGLVVPPGLSQSFASIPNVTGQTLNFFMLAGHMHWHGTDFKLWYQDGGTTSETLGGDNGPLLYENQNTDSPTEDFLTPPLVAPPNSIMSWSCSYANWDGGTIEQPDEMCAVLGIYYPAPNGSLSCFANVPDAGLPPGFGACIYGSPADGGSPYSVGGP
ncbi:MAG: hypothetical protein ACYCWW_03005 [Deltaproteobacteria bacterium]